MLEQKISELTAAVVALTAAMQAGLPTAASVAAVAPQTFAAPAAAPPANGMPGGPFGAPAAAPVAAPPTFAPPASGAPFADVNGCTKYAMESYPTFEAKGKPELITQIITHLCGSGNINDLPVAKYGEFYALVEQQKSL
jgi:hypothetical protein